MLTLRLPALVPSVFSQSPHPLLGLRGAHLAVQASTDLRNTGDELQLELPYEQIGAVAVTSVRKLLATQVLMSLVGRGPAPF